MPQVFGWSEDEFDDRARGLAALIRRVWRAIARQVAAQAEKQATVSMAVASPIPAQWTQAVDSEIVGYVRNMYLDAAGNISDTLNAPDELLIGDDLVEVYTNAARNRLVGIGNDVWKNVQAQIALGNQSGESIPEIAARIRNVAGVTEARSLTIARTEVHAAYESGSYEQAMFIDPKAEKVWLATEDERTRPSHRAADGQRVKIGASFNVGGSKLRYPGDPLGSAEDCINCRCSVAYDFDMITIVVDEPEPAMVASGGQAWKPHMHPRGNDGKFIEKGALSDFLKKSKPNIIDVQKAVGGMTGAQYTKLTDAQKQYIKDSVDKLPHGTETHTKTKQMLHIVETMTAPKPSASAPEPPKTKIGATYAKLKDAKDGDVLATGTKYSASGVAQKFKITADKSSIHPDYNPHGKMKLEFLKKNGEPSDKSYTGGILSISQKLHPLPVKGKSGKVEWDEPNAAATPDLTPAQEANIIDGMMNADTPDDWAALQKQYKDLASENAANAPTPAATAAPAKIPAGLKGKPGDPAKITTGVVWGKHPADTTVVEDEWGLLRVQWDGKKYNLQSKQEDGSWNTDAAMTKKQFYDQHKGDGTGWVIPGGTPQSSDNNGFSSDDETGQLLDDVLGPETTPEPPQTPSTPPVSTTSAPDWTKAQDFSGFTKVGGQAGSNPGGKYKAPDGAEWYLKKPKSANHAANEMAAAAFYNLAGVDAPQVMKGAGAPELGNPQTGTKIVPGAKANLGSKLQDEAYIKQLQAGFAMDAWLANWDVAGMGYDNVVEGADGKPHRIDVGGALLYRAQGEPKGNAFGDKVTELDTLRDGTNPQSAAIFGSMTDEDIRKSTAKLEAISDEQIEQIVKDAGLDASVAETLKARRQHILSKYPPISETDEVLDEVLGPPTTTTTTSPDAASAKAKLQKLYDKGLITWDEYVDATGEPPPEADAGETHADKGVLLNDLKSGAILSVPQAIDLGIMLNESDYNDLSAMEKDQLETTLSTAAAMNMPGGKDAYAHWQSLHNAPSAPDTSALTDEPDTSGPATSAGGALYYLDQDEQTKMVSSDGKFVLEQVNSPLGKYSLETKQDDGSSVFAFINDAEDVGYTTGQTASLWYPAKKAGTADKPAGPSGPMVDGSSLGLKELHSLIVNGKHHKKYSDGQVVATSPDGKKQFLWRDAYEGYAFHDVDSGAEEFLSNIHVIKKIRDDAYHVPENLIPGHSGTIVGEPDANDPVINDTETIGTTNSGALFALENGDAENMTTIDGKYELYKSADGKWIALKEQHSDGNATVHIIDPTELGNLTGLQVWYPKQEINQSTNAPDAAAGVSAKTVDLSVLQEDIDLGKFTSGEVIGVTQDGQQQLVYSAFLGGVQLKHKVGNTGDEFMDWDTEASYSDDTGSPVADFLDDYPGIKLFEPQPLQDDASGSNWENILSGGGYVTNDVVAQSEDGKFQLVHKGMGNYSLYKKDDTGAYNSAGGAYYTDDILNGDLDEAILGVSENARWKKVSPGTPFKSGKIPAKKVAKAVPHAYTPASVSPGEKKFYLTDAEDGSLVGAEVVHLLNGAGGLDVDDVKQLTPKQSANIDKAVDSALNNGQAGSGQASLLWEALKQNVPSQANVADQSYFDNMEDEMFAGSYHTGDIFAVSEDGKQRLVFHSTDGPFENPNAFALETNGPLGWETTNIYPSAAYGGASGQLGMDPGVNGKKWLIPGKDSPDLNADFNMPPVPGGDVAGVTATFNPPGDGTQTAGTIFGMMDWVPEGKVLLVGKDEDDNTYSMIATKNADGEKVVEISAFNPATGTFHPAAHLANEQEYNSWDDVNVKWDPTGVLPDTGALANVPNVTDPNAHTPNANAPAAPAAPLLPLTSDNVDAIWIKAQTLDIGTVIGTTVSGMGTERQLIVGIDGSGAKTITVRQKDMSGNWKKWNDVSTTGLKHELAAYAWTSKIHDTPSAATPSSTVGQKLLDEGHAQKLWDAAQTLPVGTILATGTNASGKSMRMVVGEFGDGTRFVRVEKKHSDGAWHASWSNTHVESVYDDLVDDDFVSAIDLDAPNAPNANALAVPNINGMTGASPDQPIMASYWGKLNSIKNNVPGGTVVAVHKDTGHTLVKTYDGIWAVEDADGTQIGMSILFTQDAMDILPDDNGDWYTPNTPGAITTPTPTPSAPTAPSTPTTPTAPTVKAVPLYKINILKANMKADGNVGYWSKPENIWAQIKKFQKLPGNTDISPMDFFTALDKTLKTDKHSYAAKMTKWAATKKGADIIGQDGLFGPQAPAAPSVVSAPDFKPENVDAIWDHIQTLPVGTVIADGKNTWNDHSRMVVKGTIEKYIEVQAKNHNDEWTYSHAATHKSSLVSDLSSTNWKWETTDEYKGTATPAASPLAGIDFSPGTVNEDKNTAAKIWSALDSLPDDTIIAHATTLSGVNKQMYVATAPDGTKFIHIKAFDPVSAQWQGYGAYKNVGHLAGGLLQKWKPGPNGSVGTPLGTPTKMPDIEAGNDISGIDDVKQKSVYDAFKAEPFTFLSSPEHSIFDAIQEVAKKQGLTLGQVLNIVDEQGALKVSKPNDGLFKKKLAAWVKTPEAAAHILNEPTDVTGLPTPPAYHPQYDPDLNKGQIPSFEESSKLTYDWVPSVSAASGIWSSVTAKTSNYSPAEEKALKVWTGGAYTTINGYLVKPNEGPLGSTHKTALKGTQLGMRPSDRPMLLVRGTGFSGLGNAKNHAQLEKMVGTTWRNNGFAASSVGRESGDPPDIHAPAFNSFPLWIEFEAPPGTPMAWVATISSVGQGEREMLLGSNLHYKILSVEKKMIPGYGMKTIARVRIVPKPEDNS